MTDLVEFLQARLDADKKTAQAAFSGQADPENGWGAERSEAYRHTTITPHVGMIHEAVQAEHVVRWNPARVLREVEAKRRIIKRYVHLARRALDDKAAGRSSRSVQDGRDTLFVTLLDLATVYAEHPDYREEWKP